MSFMDELREHCAGTPVQDDGVWLVGGSEVVKKGSIWLVSLS